MAGQDGVNTPPSCPLSKTADLAGGGIVHEKLEVGLTASVRWPTAQGAVSHHQDHTIAVLLLPTDPTQPCRLTRIIADSSVSISDALGGGLIDEIVGGGTRGGLYAVYGSDEPAGRQDNPRAAVLAARLGFHARDVQRRLRGPVLVAGRDQAGLRDLDVPVGVVHALQQAGITVEISLGLRSRGAL